MPAVCGAGWSAAQPGAVGPCGVNLAFSPCTEWAWAALFHARDLRWTERGDYFSAILFILAGLFTAVLHVLDASGVRNAVLVWLLRALCAGVFAAHARTMDAEFRLWPPHAHLVRARRCARVNVGCVVDAGATHERDRVARSRTKCPRVRLGRFRAPRLPAASRALDAHALWHASTAPLGHLLWVYFVEVDGVPPDDQTAALVRELTI